MSDKEMTLIGYGDLLEEIKGKVRTARTQAALAVNRELITLYWELGRMISNAQQTHQWGDNVLLQLSKDLQAAFPGVSGFSRTNLYRIRAFYVAYCKLDENVPQAVDKFLGDITLSYWKG